MINLPNGCRCSKPAIVPKNYKTTTKGKWRIVCRFYDSKGVFYVNMKTVNQFEDLKEKRRVAEVQRKTLENMLLAGYNPRLKTTVEHEIDPKTYFIPALKVALSRLQIEPKTKSDIGYYIKNCEKASLVLGYDMMLIKDITRRNIVYLLDRVKLTNKKFSANTFNKYRTYLSMLFEELFEIEAVDDNPVSKIKKKPIEAKERILLSPAERKKVMEYLKKNDPWFERFTHIFFHSGARISELMLLKGSDVDLENQQFRCTVKKGKKHRIVWRTIKNIALPYWQKQVADISVGDIVFSEGLQPGLKPIRADQITKRWTRVAKKLKIKATFYSLKHLNTTEVVDHLDEKAAALLNGHTSEAMVIKIYDQRQKDRRHQELKEVNNPL